jgi:hypothetical protein
MNGRPNGLRDPEGHRRRRVDRDFTLDIFRLPVHAYRGRRVRYSRRFRFPRRCRRIDLR